MQAIPIEHISENLRQFILNKTKETCNAIETLKAQYTKAVRSKDNETANRTCAQLADLCSPENPSIRIIGGASGYVLFDEKRLNLTPVFLKSSPL